VTGDSTNNDPYYHYTAKTEGDTFLDSKSSERLEVSPFYEILNAKKKATLSSSRSPARISNWNCGAAHPPHGTSAN